MLSPGKAERTVDTATVLSLISASNGMLTIDDFIEQGALRRKPFHFRNLCPLCGHKLENAKRKNPADAQIAARPGDGLDR